MLFFYSSDVFVNCSDSDSSSSFYKSFVGFFFKIISHSFPCWTIAGSLSICPSSFHLLSVIVIDNGSVSETW